MTTDTYPKVAGATAMLGGVEVTINGMAKGAGMIAPDMATLLSYVFTDAPDRGPCPAGDAHQGGGRQLQRNHRRQRHVDLRHSDAVCDRRRRPPRRAEDCQRRRPPARAVQAGARSGTPGSRPSVVRDGEGCRKFVEIQVEGRRARARPSGSHFPSPIRRWSRRRSPARMPIGAASSPPSARPARRQIATSSPSWFGDIRVAHKGLRGPAYDEAEVSALMKEDKIVIRVDIGAGGTGKAVVWTCDLTKDYVAINGDYRS